MFWKRIITFQRIISWTIEFQIFDYLNFNATERPFNFKEYSTFSTLSVKVSSRLYFSWNWTITSSQLKYSLWPTNSASLPNISSLRFIMSLKLSPKKIVSYCYTRHAIIAKKWVCQRGIEQLQCSSGYMNLLYHVKHVYPNYQQRVVEARRTQTDTRVFRAMVISTKAKKSYAWLEIMIRFLQSFSFVLRPEFCKHGNKSQSHKKH